MPQHDHFHLGTGFVTTAARVEYVANDGELDPKRRLHSKLPQHKNKNQNADVPEHASLLSLLRRDGNNLVLEFNTAAEPSHAKYYSLEASNLKDCLHMLAYVENMRPGPRQQLQPAVGCLGCKPCGKTTVMTQHYGSAPYVFFFYSSSVEVPVAAGEKTINCRAATGG